MYTCEMLLALENQFTARSLDVKCRSLVGMVVDGPCPLHT